MQFAGVPLTADFELDLFAMLAAIRVTAGHHLHCLP